MPNETHDLTIPLASPAAHQPAPQALRATPVELETLSYEEALLRPRPITFRDLTGCITTLGGGSNSLHEPAGSPATHSYAQVAASK
jgi:hypothetical protein